MAVSDSGSTFPWRARTVLPTDHGVFTTYAFDVAGITHVALVAGDPSADPAPFVRMHSECLTGDALGSHRCDCGDQLQTALATIAAAGCGIVLYLRGHEGRGIGLGAKLEAYELQDGGLDTVDANRRLGLPDDARDYAAAAHMLTALGVGTVRLLSSNPSKAAALEALGITVAERRMLPVADRPENAGYLDTKRRRMHHDRPHAAALLEPAQAVDLESAPEAPTPPEASLASAASVPSTSQATTASGPDYAQIAATGEVVAQLAQSSDGFIAARGGDADFVSGEHDRAHLHRLRAAAGAVIVGAQTVISDDPQLTVRAVPGENPTRVILDPRARVPLTARVLREAAAPTLWLVGTDAEVPFELPAHVTVVRLPGEAGGPGDADAPPDTGEPQHAGLPQQSGQAQHAGQAQNPRGRVPAAAVLTLVRAHVDGAVLVEGGGRTVSEFLTAGLLDRLFLTVAPVFIGDGVPGIRFAGSAQMSAALRAPFRRWVFGPDMCTEFVLSDRAVACSAGLSHS